MQKLILATRNKGKLEEIRDLLKKLPYTVHPVSDFPHLPEVEEDGETLEANALKKARTIFSIVHLPTISDDTGLEVAALGMKPGVYSARYAGENATYKDNYTKLLKEMEGIPAEKRTARFRCVAAYVSAEEERIFEGACDGRIIESVRGTNGFGYDPVFLPDGLNETFAELSLATKNIISHRAKAFLQLQEYLTAVNLRVAEITPEKNTHTKI